VATGTLGPGRMIVFGFFVSRGIVIIGGKAGVPGESSKTSTLLSSMGESLNLAFSMCREEQVARGVDKIIEVDC